MINQRFLTQQDAGYLAWMAEEKLRLRDVVFNVGEDLVRLLSAAILLPDNVELNGYVSLNSEVVYRIVGQNELQFLAIVFPIDRKDAFLAGYVITPLALACIGRRVSDIVSITRPGGRIEMAEILSVNSLNCVALEPF